MCIRDSFNTGSDLPVHICDFAQPVEPGNKNHFGHDAGSVDDLCVHVDTRSS